MADANTSQRRSLGVIALVVFIDLVGFSMIFPLLPAMLEYYLPAEEPGSLIGVLYSNLVAFTGDGPQAEFYATVLFGGILGSLYSLIQFIFAPIWGSMSDRIGRRPVLMITTVGTALGYLLWVFSGSFVLLLIARVINGAMAGNLSVATAGVADVTKPENRAKAMGLIGACFGIGFVFGPAIGGLSAGINLLEMQPSWESFGINPFSVPALFSFVLAVVNVVLVIIAYKETLPEGQRSQKERPSVFALFSVKAPDTARAIFVYLLFIIAFAGMEFTLTFLALERFAYQPADMTKIFLFVGIILIITQGGLVRRLAPKMGEKKLIVLGLACGVVAYLLLALPASQPVFYGALAFLGVGAGLVSPLTSSLVSRYTSEQEQGRYLGIYRSAGSFARGVGPFMAALLYWKFGASVLYGIGAVWTIVPLALSLKLVQPKV